MWFAYVRMLEGIEDAMQLAHIWREHVAELVPDVENRHARYLPIGIR